MEEKRFLAWGERGRQGIGPLARGEPLAKGRESGWPEGRSRTQAKGRWLEARKKEPSRSSRRGRKEQKERLDHGWAMTGP